MSCGGHSAVFLEIVSLGLVHISCDWFLGAVLFVFPECHESIELSCLVLLCSFSTLESVNLTDLQTVTFSLFLIQKLSKSKCTISSRNCYFNRTHGIGDQHAVFYEYRSIINLNSIYQISTVTRHHINSS